MKSANLIALINLDISLSHSVALARAEILARRSRECSMQSVSRATNDYYSARQVRVQSNRYDSHSTNYCSDPKSIAIDISLVALSAALNELAPVCSAAHNHIILNSLSIKLDLFSNNLNRNESEKNGEK